MIKYLDDIIKYYLGRDFSYGECSISIDIPRDSYNIGWNIQNVSAPTDSQIYQIWKQNKLIFARNRVISKIKRNAFKLLSETDWKVIRHRDQVDLGVTTSLSNAEYIQLLTDRNNIRLNTNQIENELNSITSVETIENYNCEL